MNKANLILNSTIELVDVQEEGNGKGRPFVSRFLEPGIAHYKELGDILITKETLNKFINTMVGCPVIIEHEDVTDENADKLRVGVVSRVWFNEMDGYFYCEGILTDPEAIDLVKNQGYNVSCAYSFVSDNTKKTHNGKEIDMEFIDGEFLHLALVKDPRYEGANIVVNKNDDDLEWITVKGNHIPIKKGQSKDEAVKEFLEGKQSDTKDKHGFKKDKDSGYYMKDLPDGTSVYVEKKEGGQGEKEPFFLEATHFDKDGKEIAKKQYHYDSMDGMFSKIDRDFSPKDKSGDNNAKKESKEEKSKSQKPNISDYKFKNYQNPDAFLQGHMKQCETIKDTFEYVLSETDRKFENVKKSYWGNTPPAKQFRIELDNINRHNATRDIMDSWTNRNKDYKPVIDDIKAYQQKLLSQLEGYNKWNGKEWVKEKQNKNVNNNIGDITMTVLNDLTDFIKKVVKNEKDEEMKEVKNEDKRKLIDEVGGILKGKIDEELWRTVIGKLEKVAYEPSEDSKADNEDDEEKEAKNKCKNEEDEEEEIEEKVTENEDKEEDKKEDKEDKAENKKVKNSMKDIVMGGSSQAQTQKLYTSRKERLEEGNKY